MWSDCITWSPAVNLALVVRLPRTEHCVLAHNRRELAGGDCEWERKGCRPMQFRIRDLIWTMLLTALAVSWWLDHRRLSRQVLDLQEPGPTLVTAEGKVTWKDLPVGHIALTVLYPDGNTATGYSDANGDFYLTFVGRLGAVPGSRLPVTVVEIDKSTETGIPIPAGYDSFRSTPLRITVPASGSKRLRLELSPDR